MHFEQKKELYKYSKFKWHFFNKINASKQYTNFALQNMHYYQIIQNTFFALFLLYIYKIKTLKENSHNLYLITYCLL